MAKEKTKAADLTSDLLPKRARGRPSTGAAKTNAERQAAYRAKAASDTINATIARLAHDFDMTRQEVTRELLRFALCNRKWEETGFPSQQ